jgi:hypothetical protein
MLQRPGYQYNLFNRASCPETLEETTKIDPNLFLVRFTPVSTLYALLCSALLYSTVRVSELLQWNGE